MTDTAQYRKLVALARRHARRSDEAEDIVQDVLVSAVIAGRDALGPNADWRWLAGAIRKRAAHDARSAERRRARETGWSEIAGQDPQEPDLQRQALQAVLAGLPRAQRVVAALALSGHSRREIAHLLRLSDDALRQRIRTLKRTMIRRGSRLPDGLPGLSLDLAYGTIRAGLAAVLRRNGGAFATHDPDGHFFVVRRSQNRQPRQHGT